VLKNTYLVSGVEIRNS